MESVGSVLSRRGADRETPADGQTLRLLTFSTLFPHAGRPNHGIFVENRLRHLLATGEATSTVVAPVPWFPSRAARFGDWARHAMADRVETRDGLEIHHPRYLQLPKIGMLAAPPALFAAGALAIRRAMAEGRTIDLIDAHYLYPDGVAAVALGRAFGKPVVVTARGSDVTQYPDHAGPRRLIKWAIAESAALISVSEGLRQALIGLGAPAEKVTTLRNGVDLSRFREVDGRSLRASWDRTGPVLLSVGHLIERKGHHLAIESLTNLPGWTLVIVGEGPERGRLEALAGRLGVSERVVLAGAQPHDRLATYYSAADILVLASSREGWANVLLEAMACGTPVVASNIPGNPEVVQQPAAGMVVVENSAACFATTIAALYATKPDHTATRRYAEGFSWESTSAGQLALFRRILGRV